MLNRIKVAVALSGGVDSAAATYILKEKGYEVFGLTMKLFEGFDATEAQKIANKLDIDHYIVDFSHEFEDDVINKFINEYMEGRTPNPCIFCNVKIKYGLLLEKAKDMGADYMALGHYARIIYDNNEGKYHLYKGKFVRKDQSYNLYHLNQTKLSSILLPLGEYEDKEKVRELIKSVVPDVSRKKDSNDICFANGLSYFQYIKDKRDLINTKGNFIDRNGKYISKHNGIQNYTIGQKKGLGQSVPDKSIVVGINHETNEIVLGKEEDVYKSFIEICEVSYIDEENREKEYFSCEVKLCQWGELIKCIVFNCGINSCIVEFIDKQRAPAVGQAAVLYAMDEVIGGGIISSAY